MGSADGERKMITTDDLIRAALAKLRAPRGERFVHAGGRGMRTRTPGRRTIYLANGAAVEVRTDDSGVATQVEHDDALHAVVRPQPVRLHLTQSGE